MYKSLQTALVYRSTKSVLQQSVDLLPRANTRNGTNDLSFECPQTFNPKVYFDNSFGVIVDEEYDVEKIRIKVYGNQCKYFRSLPLHHSQKESETHSNYSIFDYSLRPTYDFCQAILSHGNLVEVLEPQWFRIQIGTMIQKMNQLYQ